MNFTPRAELVHIRLSKPAEKSRGGVYIPETAAHLTTEGTVLATGEGHWIAETGKRYPVWLMAGEIALFNQHSLTPLGENEGLLSEEEVVATVDPEDNSLHPEGDWVLVDPDPAPEETSGGIALADSAKRSPRSGVVLALGPGLLRFRGPLAGLRNPVWRALSLSGPHELIGQRAYWAGDAEVLHAAGKALVRGRDLLAIEESDPA